MNKRFKVLFLCTGNMTRSLMAQAFFRRLAGNNYLADSTATESAELDPCAADVMREVGIDLSWQQSTSVAQALREHYVYVITVSDPARERAPIFPFTLNLLHWAIPDPSTIQGSPAQKRVAFRRVRDQLESQIRSFLHETNFADVDQRHLALA